MLKRLHIRNFTVFAEADFEFGPGLNVVVGTNGTGKSHVLKLGYVLLEQVLWHLSATIKEHIKAGVQPEPLAQKYMWTLKNKLQNVFRPVQLGPIELVRRGASEPQANMSITVDYPGGESSGGCSIYPGGNVVAAQIWPIPANINIDFVNPILIPAKETLTSGWLLSLYDQREVPIDETYPDLLRLLSVLPLKNHEPSTAKILEQLRQLIGGKVEEEGGRFYLSAPEQPRVEMNLVAEGMRKFATLYKLLANGMLTPETTLFWDEPEANLNPALLRQLAGVLADLARQGFQIILATHSMSLLKQFHILSRRQDGPPLPIRYFGLNAAPGQPTTVATRNDFELLPDVVALDVELEQADELESIFAKEDQLPDADHR